MRDESNSSVKRRGKGVGEGSGVDEGSGTTVAGIGEGRGVEVGKSEGASVGVAVWQAVIRMRQPNKRSFFMALFITQLSIIIAPIPISTLS
jgi:hypothetical protein